MASLKHVAIFKVVQSETSIAIAADIFIDSILYYDPVEFIQFFSILVRKRAKSCHVKRLAKKNQHHRLLHKDILHKQDDNCFSQKRKKVLSSIIR